MKEQLSARKQETPPPIPTQTRESAKFGDIQPAKIEKADSVMVAKMQGLLEKGKPSNAFDIRELSEMISTPQFDRYADALSVEDRTSLVQDLHSFRERAEDHDILDMNVADIAPIYAAIDKLMSDPDTVLSEIAEPGEKSIALADASARINSTSAAKAQPQTTLEALSSDPNEQQISLEDAAALIPKKAKTVRIVKGTPNTPPKKNIAKSVQTERTLAEAIDKDLNAIDTDIDGIHIEEQDPMTLEDWEATQELQKSLLSPEEKNSDAFVTQVVNREEFEAREQDDALKVVMGVPAEQGTVEKQVEAMLNSDRINMMIDAAGLTNREAKQLKNLPIAERAERLYEEIKLGVADSQPDVVKSGRKDVINPVVEELLAEFGGPVKGFLDRKNRAVRNGLDKFSQHLSA